MNQQLITAAYAAWCEGNDLRTRWKIRAAVTT